MSKSNRILSFLIIICFLTSIASPNQHNILPTIDLSTITGGLFDNSWADFACGVGVGLAFGVVAFFSGGAALIAEAIVVPKALAACIYAGVL